MLWVWVEDVMMTSRCGNSQCGGVIVGVVVNSAFQQIPQTIDVRPSS